MTFLKQMAFADWYHTIIGTLGFFGTRYVCLSLNNVLDERYFVEGSGIERLFANLVELLRMVIAIFGGCGSVVMVIGGLMSFYSKRHNDLQEAKRDLWSTQAQLHSAQARLEELDGKDMA
jgi:hypothetical protein